MKITFVRHAQTEQNYLEVCQGLQNNPLCDDGRRQALKLKEKLKDKHFDYCYMSPMLRTVETAIILIGDRVETIPDKRIIERNLGELENVPRKFYDYKKYWDYNLNCSDRGVEPVQDIFKRCEDFLNYIKEKHKGQSILIVSHSSPIRAMIHIIENTDRSSKLYKKVIDNLFCEEYEIKE